MDLWAYTNKVILDFSRRGKPTDNAAIESFNGRFRDECLNVHWFESLGGREQQDRGVATGLQCESSSSGSQGGSAPMNTPG